MCNVLWEIQTWIIHVYFENPIFTQGLGSTVCNIIYLEVKGMDSTELEGIRIWD